MFETVSLLKNTLLITPQHEATKVKYPCVGFKYIAIQNKNKIIDLYTLGTDKNYNDYIKNLICRAGRRKKSNLLILIANLWVMYRRICIIKVTVVIR